MKPFAQEEPYFIRPGVCVHASSENFHWRTISAVLHSCAASEYLFGEMNDPVIVVRLGGHAQVTRTLMGKSLEYISPPGSITIIPPNSDFRFISHAHTDNLIIYLRHELLEEISGISVSSLALQSPHCAIDPLIENIGFELRNILNSSESNDDLYVETIAQTLSYRLLRAYSAQSRMIPTWGSSSNIGLTPAQHNRICDYIDCNLESKLNLSDLARETGLGQRQFSERFKVTLGCSPYQYILRKRILRAKQLILKSDFSFAAIALQCGFCDQQHMTHKLVQIDGITPSALRRKALGNL